MKRTLWLLIIVILFVSGCGYHTPGQGDAWVGQGGETLYVELFVNRTAEPYLENFITDEVVFQMSRSRLAEVVEDAEGADLFLAGTVTDFDIDAHSYSSDDRISEYRVKMKIEAKLVQRSNDEILWKGKLNRSEVYLATLDKNLQLEGESQAIKEISRRLAEDLYARLHNDF